MSHAEELLQQQLQLASANTLLLLDENTIGLNLANCQGQLISNRFDIAALSPAVIFNDFDLQRAQNAATIERIVWRIAKEKRINLHIIQQSFALLNPGELILIGYKNEGIKSLISTINAHYDCDISIEKHPKQLQQLTIHIPRAQQQSLQTPNYAQLQLFTLNDLRFYSKAGTFGWQKVDRGSELLMDYLQGSGELAGKEVLDLGAGYGYLSIRAHLQQARSIDATDNCAAALLCCEKNFLEYGIIGNVIADNCGHAIGKKYQSIICNPPFHQGFEHEKSLTERFIEQAALHLKPSGQAFFVVNQFIGIEKQANKHFTNCELLVKKEGFKIMRLSL